MSVECLKSSCVSNRYDLGMAGVLDIIQLKAVAITFEVVRLLVRV